MSSGQVTTSSASASLAPLPSGRLAAESAPGVGAMTISPRPISRELAIPLVVRVHPTVAGVRATVSLRDFVDDCTLLNQYESVELVRLQLVVTTGPGAAAQTYWSVDGKVEPYDITPQTGPYTSVIPGGAMGSVEKVLDELALDRLSSELRALVVGNPAPTLHFEFRGDPTIFSQARALVTVVGHGMRAYSGMEFNNFAGVEDDNVHDADTGYYTCRFTTA